MVDSYRFLGGVANSARSYPQFCSSAVVCVRRPSWHFSATLLKKRGHDAELQSRAQLGESRDISSVEPRTPRKYDGFHRIRRIRAYRSPNVKMNPVEARSPFWLPLFPVTRLGKVVST